jgi:enterochelin esterase-like enzyme
MKQLKPWLFSLFLFTFLAVACAAPAEQDRIPYSTPGEEQQLAGVPEIIHPSAEIEKAAPSPPSYTYPATREASIPPPGMTPTSSPTPKAATCWRSEGHFENGSLETPRKKDPVEFRIFLPPCYDVDSERRHPVLYLLHGQGFTDEQWERIGAGETASRLIADGEVPPFLIVMPRYRSWTEPYKNDFGRVMVEELIPWIDAEYRTIPERNYRAVGGLSKGAGWAVHLGLKYWETFAAIGGHSLAVFWNDTLYIRTWLEEIPRENLPRIYLDIGDQDRSVIMSSNNWFSEVLVDYGVPHEWYLFSGNHDEAYWRENAERYLRWYSLEW